MYHLGKTADYLGADYTIELVGNKNQIDVLRHKYLNGGVGYGDTKQELFELILEKFKTERTKFKYYNENPREVELALEKGANKASKIADEVLLKVRRKLGF